MTEDEQKYFTVFNLKFVYPFLVQGSAGDFELTLKQIRDNINNLQYQLKINSDR